MQILKFRFEHNVLNNMWFFNIDKTLELLNENSTQHDEKYKEMQELIHLKIDIKFDIKLYHDK